MVTAEVFSSGQTGKPFLTDFKRFRPTQCDKDGLANILALATSLFKPRKMSEFVRRSFCSEGSRNISAVGPFHIVTSTDSGTVGPSVNLGLCLGNFGKWYILLLKPVCTF